MNLWVLSNVRTFLSICVPGVFSRRAQSREEEEKPLLIREEVWVIQIKFSQKFASEGAMKCISRASSDKCEQSLLWNAEEGGTYKMLCLYFYVM
jgi:hypothetical protein